MGSSTGNAIDRLRLEAKCLLKDIRRGDAAALRRFTPYWPASGPSSEVRNLSRTQLVIARERGYRSWAHLKTSLLPQKERAMPTEFDSMNVEQRDQLIVWAEKFRMMLRSGMPLLKCTTILAAEARDPSLKAATRRIHEVVKNGGTISEAMQEAADVFDETVVNMMRLGENHAVVDIMLNAISEYVLMGRMQDRKK
jgi:type II secretory pathway component PulF